MEIILPLVALACVAVFMLIYIWSVAWAVGDAQRRGQSGGLVVFLFWLFGPLGALVWLGVRPKTKLVDRSPEDYTNPDDALADAACLDHLGEWDAALVLYEHAARRWPKRHEYIAARVRQVKEKQSLA